MKTGVIVMNFGEPAEATLDTVVPFLERIFRQNPALERDAATARRRARELAEARAPGLVEEYRAIGGSPLNLQADAQAEALQAALRDRGHDVTVYCAFQYTEPFIRQAVVRARADGAERLVGLPVYPMCGHSTTVLALQELAGAIEDEEGWDPPLLELSGWHRHPDFVPMWVDQVTRFLYDEGVDLPRQGTELVFSIHGTPLRYLEGGNRYDRYVDEACAAVARGLGVPRYHMGYQNHTNRPVAWTQPDVEDVIEALGDAGSVERVVVVPIAFMHEQSETLAELDRELKEAAVEAGLAFHRVPVPHDRARFHSLLADLVEARLGHPPASGCEVELRRCICRRGGQGRCTNGLRLAWTVEVEGFGGEAAASASAPS